MKSELSTKTQIVLFVIGAISITSVGAYIIYTRNHVELNPSETINKTVVSAPMVQDLPLVSQDQPEITLDAYTLCQEMDAVSKAGESVAKFISNSGRSDNYIQAASVMCTWHQRQADEAEIIIEERTNQNDSGWFGSQEQGIWNDCDGIKDPGETFSSACANRQTVERQQQEIPKWGGPEGLH